MVGVAVEPLEESWLASSRKVKRVACALILLVELSLRQWPVQAIRQRLYFLLFDAAVTNDSYAFYSSMDIPHEPTPPGFLLVRKPKSCAGIVFDCPANSAKRDGFSQ